MQYYYSLITRVTIICVCVCLGPGYWCAAEGGQEGAERVGPMYRPLLPRHLCVPGAGPRDLSPQAEGRHLGPPRRT